MAGNKWTAEQNTAIRARGGTLLVSAAAGSGKTAVLVERVAGMLLDREHPIDADRLLVVTFTSAAAKEMQQRIEARLAQEQEKAPFDPLIRRQRFLMERAHISTVHAFCLELVKKHTQELGIPMDFSLGDDSQIALLREEAAAAAIEQCYAEDEENRFAALVELLSGERDDRQVISVLFKLHQFVRSHPFYEDWLKEKLKMYDADRPVKETVWGEAIISYAKEAVGYCRDIYKPVLETIREDPALSKAYLSAYLSDDLQLEKLSEVICSGSWDDCCARVRSFTFDRLGSLRGYEDKQTKAMVSGARDVMKKIIGNLANKLFCAGEEDFRSDILDLRPKVESLFDLTLRYDNLLQQIKKERKLIDFSDLEHYALQLLMKKENGGYVRTELAGELSADYEQILVDEYQDTNAAQDMIFYAVSQNRSNLFMVGDIKQSIYRFRQAMPELFLAKMDSFSPLDEAKRYPAKLQLSRNFRSRSEVTGLINFVFSLLMSRSVGEIEYNEEHALFPGAVYAEQQGLEAELVLLKNENGAEAAVRCEAEYVAKRIARMLTEQMPVTENGKTRPIRMSDICILLRSSKKRAEIYRDELLRQGINSWSESRSGFLRTKEITVMVALLQVLDNPYRDIPLLTVLLSDLIGMSPEQTARIRLLDRRGALYSGLLAAAQQGQEAAQQAVELIESLRRLAVRLPVADLITEIYIRTNYPAIAASYPMGEVRRGNLHQLVRYAENYGKKGSSGLYGFVRFLDRLQEKDTDLDGASMGTAVDAVSITSIHRSKGLEFPVVFLCDTARQFNKKDLIERISLHPQMGFACVRRDRTLYKEFTTIPLEALRLENERADLSEELRVLYVAMTRAREKLIMTGAGRIKTLLKPSMTFGGEKPSPFLVRSANSLADWLILCALRHPAGQVLRREAGVLPIASAGEIPPFTVRLLDTEEREELTAVTTEIRQAGEADECLYARLKEAAQWVYPNERSCLIPQKSGVSALTKQAGRDQYAFSKVPRFLSGQEMSGAQKGNAVHQFMQFADYEACAQDLPQEIRRMEESAFLSHEQIAVLDREKLKRFFQSPLYARIAGSDRTEREIRFLREVPADRLGFAGISEPVTVQGVADCVFWEEGKLVIVDYKTDVVASLGTLVEHYAGQLALYREILAESLQTEVKECIIYSFHLGQEISLE